MTDTERTVTDPVTDPVTEERAEEIIAAQHNIEPEVVPAEARPKPQIRLQTVTPEMAEKWLKANIHNRDLRQSRVMALAKSIVLGEYRLTTDAIGFDTRGWLMNGQHRLSAIWLAEQDIDLFVARGLSPEAQDITDQGLHRSMPDVLKLRGETNYVTLATALEWVYRLRYSFETGSAHYSDGGQKPSVSQKLGLLTSNPELRMLTREVTRLKRGVPMRAGVMVALWNEFRLLDADDADLFVYGLATGEDLKRDNPVWIMRRVLIQDKQRYTSKMPDYREAALLIKAWNAFREQRPILNLTFKYSPRQRERFPVPV